MWGCASNGIECLSRIAKYKKSVSPVIMMIDESGDEVSISHSYDDGDELNEIMQIHIQMSILSIIRKGTGDEDIYPVKITAAVPYSKKLVEYFKVEPLIKKGYFEIVFKREDLEKPFVTKNNKLWELHRTEFDQSLKSEDEEISFSAIVRTELAKLLPTGVSDSCIIATRLGMSKRTLQRKLSDENTTFNMQLNRVREIMVKNYIDNGVSLEEVAFFVNYSDAKTLSRAFKSWTGMSVSEYRNKMKESKSLKD